MEISFAEKPDLDDFLRQHLKAARADETKLTLRVVPQVYAPETKQYQAWPDVAWKILVEQIEEPRLLKKALDEFFDALSRKGAMDVVNALRDL